MSKPLMYRRFSQVTMVVIVNIVIIPYQIFNIAECIEGILSLLSLWLSLQGCFSSTNQYSCHNSKALGWGHTHTHTHTRYSYGPRTVQRKFEYFTHTNHQTMLMLY